MPYGPHGNAWDAGTPSGLAIDAWGNAVPPGTPRYVYMIQRINGSDHYVWRDNPNFRPTVADTNPASAPSNVAPHFQFTFDTIGQTIYRMIGHCRLPLRIIWASSITNVPFTSTTTSTDSGGNTTTTTTTTTSPVMSFGAALGAPIDQNEEGTVVGIFSGGGALYDADAGGTIVPDSLDSNVAGLLITSINNLIVYPGDEAQEPAPLIVADKGSDVTNAFRGIRYIIFQDWPLEAGSPSDMSIQWDRTSSLGSAAVEFAPLSG